MKKHRFPFPVRLLLWLLLAGILFYGGIVGFICIREGSVARTVDSAADYDAIIVLGAQVLPDGTPNVQLSWRLDAALEAYQKNNVPIVVCGAQGRDEPVTEAEAMKRYLEDRGVPGDRILTDGKSFNTRQNLRKASGLGSPCKQEYWIKNHFREALAWIKYWGVKYLHLPLE